MNTSTTINEIINIKQKNLLNFISYENRNPTLQERIFIFLIPGNIPFCKSYLIKHKLRIKKELDSQIDKTIIKKQKKLK